MVDGNWDHQSIMLFPPVPITDEPSALRFTDLVDDWSDRYGAKGWQLVVATPLTRNGTTYAVQYVFRRYERII